MVRMFESNGTERKQIQYLGKLSSASTGELIRARVRKHSIAAIIKRELIIHMLAISFVTTTLIT